MSIGYKGSIFYQKNIFQGLTFMRRNTGLALMICTSSRGPDVIIRFEAHLERLGPSYSQSSSVV